MEYLLTLPLIAWWLVSFAIYRSVRFLARSERLFQDVEVIDDEAFLKQKAVLSEWCLKNGFEHDRDFLFHGMLNAAPGMCSAWWSTTDSTWALICFSPHANNIDFVTTYVNGVSVTTSSSRDALTLPRDQNSHAQAFTNMNNDDRYARHGEAVKEVEHYYCISKEYEKGELIEKISAHIKGQVSYVESLPFWYLRGAYWYFVCRYCRANKKVCIK